jgi:hypothetical protein
LEFGNPGEKLGWVDILKIRTSQWIGVNALFNRAYSSLRRAG